MNGHPGYSLPELVTALALSSIVCAGIFGALAGGERIARSHAWRVARAEALQLSAAVLASELRALDPSADVRALAGDSVALRAFRGIAVVCAPADAGNGVIVRYRGIRDPEPAKDSVLILRTDGAARPVKLYGSAAVEDGCAAGDGEELMHWTLAEPPREGALALLFESGSYQFADSALRYRRGAGGRQPVTAELLDARASGFRPLEVDTSGSGAVAPAAAEVVLVIARREPRTPGAGPAARAFRFRIAFLNRRAVARAGGR